MEKEFGHAMMLILTIIFICSPLQPDWNSLDILKIFFPLIFFFFLSHWPVVTVLLLNMFAICGAFSDLVWKCVHECVCAHECVHKRILFERGIGWGENTYVCIWQRFPSQSQSHCLLFSADLSTDPTTWVPQMSVRDRSTHLSLTASLQYNHPADGR